MGAVQGGLEQVVAQTAADEIIVASQIFDHAARLHSYEIAIAAAAEVSPALELQNASTSARGGVHGGTAGGHIDDRRGTLTSENPLPDGAP